MEWVPRNSRQASSKAETATVEGDDENHEFHDVLAVAVNRLSIDFRLSGL
jgi:hypothetical protein